MGVMEPEGPKNAFRSQLNIARGETEQEKDGSAAESEKRVGETEVSPLNSVVKELLAQAEAADEVAVALDVLVLQVLEQLAALADQLEQARASYNFV